MAMNILPPLFKYCFDLMGITSESFAVFEEAQLEEALFPAILFQINAIATGAEPDPGMQGLASAMLKQCGDEESGRLELPLYVRIIITSAHRLAREAIDEN